MAKGKPSPFAKAGAKGKPAASPPAGKPAGKPAPFAFKKGGRAC